MEEEYEEIERMTPAEVAVKLNATAESIRSGLRQDKFPFGVAFQGKTGQWNYIIIKNKFYNWAEANKIKVKRD